MTVNAAIVLDTDGFRFEGVDSSAVKWSAVRRITTHKVDLLTTDEIRLVIEHDGSPGLIEVSEEQPGFERFRYCAEKLFQFPSGWWEAVMNPAFAANEAVLFTRAEQSHAGDARNARP